MEMKRPRRRLVNVYISLSNVGKRDVNVGNRNANVGKRNDNVGN
jgi:hypothetical protein